MAFLTKCYVIDQTGEFISMSLFLNMTKFTNSISRWPPNNVARCWSYFASDKRALDYVQSTTYFLTFLVEGHVELWRSLRSKSLLFCMFMRTHVKAVLCVAWQIRTSYEFMEKCVGAFQQKVNMLAIAMSHQSDILHVQSRNMILWARGAR